VETKSNRPPYTPIPIKSPQPSESADNLSLDLESIHQRLTIEAFFTQMEIVDPALLEFFRSIAHYSQLMISSLRFSPEDEKRLQHSSPLHDLGRMGIDRRIIEKKGKLTPQEWQVIQTIRAEKIEFGKILFTVYVQSGKLIRIEDEKAIKSTAIY